MIVSILFFVSMLANDACLLLDGPQIRAGDLALRLAAFASLPPETVFSLSPNYGVRRDLSSQTLARWAGGGAFEPICVYRSSGSSQPDWPQELSTALRTAFAIEVDAALLKVLEQQIAPGPGGKVLLPMSGLSYDASRRSYLWRGKIGGAALRLRFSMTRFEPRLAASRALLIGHKLAAEDTMPVEVPWMPSDGHALSSIEMASEKVLRRSLVKGTILLETHLVAAPLIEPGDTVDLLSQAGRASIHIATVARGKARLGDPLLLSTLSDHRLLRAIATGPGKAEIRNLNSRKAE